VCVSRGMRPYTDHAEFGFQISLVGLIDGILDSVWGLSRQLVVGGRSAHIVMYFVHVPTQCLGFMNWATLHRVS